MVNIILRKDVQGLEVKADTGWSRYDDGKANKASITYGIGDLDEDKFNWVVNAEYNQSDRIKNSDRANRRAHIGNGDLRAYGFPIGTQFAGGYINGTNNVSPSPTGMVRDPVTTISPSLSGAASCGASGAACACAVLGSTKVENTRAITLTRSNTNDRFILSLHQTQPGTASEGMLRGSKALIKFRAGTRNCQGSQFPGCVSILTHSTQCPGVMRFCPELQKPRLNSRKVDHDRV